METIALEPEDDERTVVITPSDSDLFSLGLTNVSEEEVVPAIAPSATGSSSENSDGPELKASRVLEITQILSTFIGLILTVVILALLLRWSHNYFTDEPVKGWLLWIGLGSLATLVVFFEGLGNNVALGHKAVLLILNGRVRVILKEGDHWLLKWVMKFREVDMREQFTRNDDGTEPLYIVGDLDEEDVKSTTLAELLETGREIAVMRVPVSVHRKTVDPYRRIDVDDKVVDRGLHDVIDNAIRSLSNNYPPLSFMGKDKLIGETVRVEAEEAATDWGESIVRVNTERILFANEEVQAAFENIAIEKREAEAETTQQNLANKLIRVVMDDFKVDFESARRFVQSERGKIAPPVDINIHSGDKPVDSVVVGSALLSGVAKTTT